MLKIIRPTSKLAESRIRLFRIPFENHPKSLLAGDIIFQLSSVRAFLAQHDFLKNLPDSEWGARG